MALKKAAYLDNAATTKIDSRVLKEMMPYLIEEYGNASSLHEFGGRALKAVSESRKIIGDFIAADPSEVIFTSGATESDNWVVKGVVEAAKMSGKPHIIISAIEHEAIIEPVKNLKAKNKIDFDYLPVSRQGIVEINKLKKLVKPNTVLISVMLANNEIGTIQPVAEIGQIVKELNKVRKQKIYLHTDATQAPAYADCRVDKLGVDLMSLSAHKIYGPKGVGALYIRKNTAISSQQIGGGQENKRRSGTYNVAGIVGFASAVKLLKNKVEIKNIRTLRDYLIKNIIKKIPNVSVNGDLKSRLPNNANLAIKGVEGESVVLMLSQKGVMASTGSACSSGSLDPSHVLLAIGLKPEVAHGSLRLTLGRYTKKSDVDALLKYLPDIVKKLRQMSPLH